MGTARPPELRLGFDERDQGRFLPGRSYSPTTQFKPGEHAAPATEIKPGERRSIPTEFQKGRAALNKQPVGSITIRTLKGKRRAWVKVSEPNVWKLRAVVAWEAINGPLPSRKVVHHRDHDSLNDDPANLVALTRAEHIAEHQIELATAAVQAAKARAA